MLGIKKIKRVHFIGIGGIGVSAVAKLMLAWDKVVTGTDTCASEITDELKNKGANIFIGSNARNITKAMDLVVYSPAVPQHDPEREKAKGLGIMELSYPQFLGLLSKSMCTVAVSGTNGKSTTTSMIGLILEKAEIDPMVIVGSKVKSFKDGNLRLSQKSKVKSQKLNNEVFFVVEGCEYKAAMLNLLPQMIVLTNIEEDHLDYYKNLAHIEETFRRYIAKVEKDGLLVFNFDDKSTREVMKNFKGYALSYGINKRALKDVHDFSRTPKLASAIKIISPDIWASNVRINNQRQVFDVYYRGKSLGMVELRVPGIFNVYNALAAIAASIALGVEFKIIRETLEKFTGIWRRFEILGELNGAVIISDYGHHPTAIAETIRAAREFYPEKRLVIAFQPHSHNRTKNLFEEFAASFDLADFVILPEIYNVCGRENHADKLSSKELVFAIQKRWQIHGLQGKKQKTKFPSGQNKKAGPDAASIANEEKKVIYAQNLDECQEILLKNSRRNDVIILMGAGDIYKLSQKLKIKRYGGI